MSNNTSPVFSISQEDRLLNIKETALFLNVKESWLRSAIFRQIIPFIKLGNLIRFKKEEINNWLEQNKKEVRNNNGQK